MLNLQSYKIVCLIFIEPARERSALIEVFTVLNYRGLAPVNSRPSKYRV